MDLPNIPDLASELARFLGPALPYLVETGKKAGEKVAGEAALAGAKKVWKKLRGKVEEKPAAKEAVEDLAHRPEDTGAQGAFKWQLEKILSADSGLAGEMAELLQTVEIEGSENAVAQIRGSKNVVVQGESNTVGGAGSYVAGRDLHVHASSRKDSGQDSLRQTYLSWVMEQTGYLALSGVDRALKGSEREARLSLEAVYTGLRTTEPRRNARREDVETLSALEQLDQHRRLVLLGAPGSGKSTFVNVLALCLAGELS
jgi:hypothetical protein